MTRIDQILIERILNKTPTSAGKIGGTEGKALRFAYQDLFRSFRPKKLRRRMHSLYELSGVYPDTKETFHRFTNYYGKFVLPRVDYLAHWRKEDDTSIHKKLRLGAEWITSSTLHTPASWWPILNKKKIMIVSPFAATIKRQIPLINEVWPSANIQFPETNITIVQCPHYAHLVPPSFPDWFEGLEDIKRTIDKIDYDILLIGAGAWSLPLTVHAKMNGKIGIHMGGALQLLFGIIGGRWKTDAFLKKYYREPYWTAPLPEDTPEKILKNPSPIVESEQAYW